MAGRVPELTAAIVAALDSSADYREGWLVSVKDMLLDPRTPQATYVQVACALTRTLQQLCLRRRTAAGTPCVIVDSTVQPEADSQAGFAPSLAEVAPWPPAPPPLEPLAPTEAPPPPSLVLDADADLRPPTWLLAPVGRRLFRAGLWHESRERWSEAQRLVHDFAAPTRAPPPLIEELLALVLCAVANPTTMCVVSHVDIVMPEWRCLLASMARLARAYHRALDRISRTLADAQRQVPPIAVPSVRPKQPQAAKRQEAQLRRLEKARSDRVLAAACAAAGLDRAVFPSLGDLERLAQHAPRLRAMLWTALARTGGVVEALRLGWATGAPAPPLVQAMMGYGPPSLAAASSSNTAESAAAAAAFSAALYAPQVRA